MDIFLEQRMHSTTIRLVVSGKCIREYCIKIRQNQGFETVVVDTTKQIYQLIEQWCLAGDRSQARATLRQIAIVSECLPEVPAQLTDKQLKYVVRWIQENHPNAYLWAMGQRCVGHPAAVWGMGLANLESIVPRIASSF